MYPTIPYNVSGHFQPARQGILTECNELPDYVELSHERRVLHLFIFFFSKM